MKYALIFLFFSFSPLLDNKYKAKVLSVYDGDTITVEVSLGLDVVKKESVRLWGINAPELKGKDKASGIVSRDSLRSWILGKEITIQTTNDKREKYGRLLGVIILGSENINQKMIELGLAKEYMTK